MVGMNKKLPYHYAKSAKYHFNLPGREISRRDLKYIKKKKLCQEVLKQIVALTSAPAARTFLLVCYWRYLKGL
jgi:hypothetical protein